jgi:hypothetical protein
LAQESGLNASSASEHHYSEDGEERFLDDKGDITVLEERLIESERANVVQAAELNRAERTIADLEAKLECLTSSSTEACSSRNQSVISNLAPLVCAAVYKHCAILTGISSGLYAALH